MTDNAKPVEAQGRAHGFLGSLKDALVAASREDGGLAKDRGGAGLRGAGEKRADAAQPLPPSTVASTQSALVPVATARSQAVTAQAAAKPAAPAGATEAAAPLPNAEAAAREVRGSVTLRPPPQPEPPAADRHVEPDLPPTTRVVRAKETKPSAPARTQLVRGRQKLVRNDFTQDPVVGWLVVVGGPGLGAFRPIFEGNNTIGRASNQRIPVDFGDDAISSEEQAYIRYDSSDRSFLFVPNLAKTNVVRINDKKPTSAVELAHMDVITMGRTQLVFVPFCGSDFDWAELADVKD